MKLLRHLLLPHSVLDRRFPKTTLDAIERAVARRRDAPQRGQVERRLDRYADFAAVPRLGFGDRVLDRIERRLGEPPVERRMRQQQMTQ